MYQFWILDVLISCTLCIILGEAVVPAKKDNVDSSVSLKKGDKVSDGFGASFGTVKNPDLAAIVQRKLL